MKVKLLGVEVELKKGALWKVPLVLVMMEKVELKKEKAKVMMKCAKKKYSKWVDSKWRWWRSRRRRRRC